MRRIIHSVIPPGNGYQAGYRIKIRLICGLTKDQALISTFTIQEVPSRPTLGYYRIYNPDFKTSPNN